ncbi:MAG TPA: EAL domain-containing protein [Spirochaetota bacterium]|nr:EAL domain-containing protein [Spirochaetota bacterium]HQE60088.1 EAL domain-containing protein [Spirochaetota bacterium]
MRASKLSVIKDFLGLGVLIGFVAAVMLVVIPHIHETENDALKNSYIEEQKLIVRNEIDSLAKRLVSFKNIIQNQGKSRSEWLKIVFSFLQNHRYGADNYGYFFIIDSKNNSILFHPLMKELEGRKLNSIITPKGKNFGILFEKLTFVSDSGYIEYYWFNKNGDVHKKTTFVKRIPEFDWIICSGFYHSDFDRTFENYSVIRKQTLSDTRHDILILVFFAGVLLALISAFIYFRIREIEKSLARQIVEFQQYKLILDESSLVSRTDVNGVIEYVNDKFCETSGFPRDALIGSKHSIERHPDTPLEVFRDLWNTIAAGKEWTGLIKNKKSDGSFYFKQVTIVPLKDETGKITGYISSGHDITELIEKRRDFDNLFNTDPLTGLGNRIRLLKDLERAQVPTVVLIDIENFSSINQTFGTETGDEILQKTGSAIFNFSDAHEISSYRVYADTFAVLCSDSRKHGEISVCIDFLAKSLNDIKFDIANNEIALVTHIGAASYGSDSFICADIALKRAKKLNRQVHIFSSEEKELPEDVLENILILSDINYAIRNDKIYSFFQPIKNLSNGQIEKYECLIRMEDKSGKIVYPDSFVELSKKTNLYQKLTFLMIEKSISAFHETGYDFAINMTIEDILNSETVSYLLDEARSKDVANRMIVEIVETEELKDLDRVISVLNQIKAEGIRIAVDDFGSGYSNFDYLIKINPAYVKIDQTIIQRVMADERAKELLKSIVLFAKNSGIQTVAEFIDSVELEDEMKRIGIDYVQGWLIGKAERTI